MKFGFYPKLALTGIAKNRKLYFPYILTSIGMVMMLYIVSFLTYNETVAAMPGGESIQGILTLGCWVISAFSVIFLFYTNSFLIRRRKKEFGLYNILGMGKGNLARIQVWETLTIAFFSLTAGLFCGVLLSKLAELCMAKVLGAEASLTFMISRNSIRLTLTVFTVIFILILVNALRQIHMANPVELLQSEAAGEKPPRANWILAVLGVGMLAIAYYLAVSIQQPLSAMLWFFIAVLLVIFGTYLLFIAGSVAVCRILKRKKKYYYQTNHFISVSSMTYRMKRNGAGLASICILSTMVLVMLSSTSCLYLGAEDSLRSRYPRNIVVDTYSDAPQYADPVHEVIDRVLKEKGQQAENVLHYRFLELAAYLDGNQLFLENDGIYTFQISSYTDVWQLFIVPLEDYNRLMGEEKSLEEGEALLYTTKSVYAYDTIALEDAKTLRVKEVVPDFVDNGTDAMQVVPSLFLFVPDIEEMRTTLAGLGEKYGGNRTVSHDYYGFDLAGNDEVQRSVSGRIKEEIRQLQTNAESFPHVSCEGVAEEREGFYGLYGGLFFLGILLAIVFICGAVLIMYYKQISEGYEDQARFEILKKVGMTRREIKKSINSQILTVFFLPLLTAGVHVAFAFPMIAKMLMLFSVTNTKFLILVTAGCYLVFALCYVLVYRATSYVYYGIVSGGREKNREFGS